MWPVHEHQVQVLATQILQRLLTRLSARQSGLNVIMHSPMDTSSLYGVHSYYGYHWLDSLLL